MARTFSEKLTIEGNIIKLDVFQRPQRVGFRGASPGRGVQSRDREKNRERTMQRARRRFFLLCNLNFASLDKFVTLTIKNPTYVSPEIANPAFKNFIDKLRKGHDRKLKYIATIELQERGVVHYHLLMQMKFLPFQQMLKKWEIGGAWIKKIPENTPTISQYMSKYIGKDITNAEINPGWENKKIFLHSRNLKTSPLMVRGKKGQISALKNTLKTAMTRATSDYEESHYEYTNEFTGKSCQWCLTLNRLNLDSKRIERVFCDLVDNLNV